MSISGFFISMFMFPPQIPTIPYHLTSYIASNTKCFFNSKFFQVYHLFFYFSEVHQKLPLQPCLLTPLPVCMPQFQETRAKEWGSSPRSFLRKMTICSFYPCTGKDERSLNYNLIVILRINFVWRLNFLNEQIIGVQSDST